MKNIEFYNGNDGSVLMTTEDGAKRLEVTDTEIIDFVADAIQQNYQEAWSKLEETYASAQRNTPFFRFLIVRRFIKCNMGEHDLLQWDIDASGSINLERVKCPLRGECPLENIVCRPKLSTGLSVRENEVLALFSEGLSAQEVADKLYISLWTVKIHAAHIVKKLKMRSMKQAIVWYNARKQS